MLAFYPVRWKIVASKKYWLEFDIQLLGISKDQSDFVEMYLFGFDFCLRTFPSVNFVIFGFQLYFARNTASLFWPNGEPLYELF